MSVLIRVWLTAIGYSSNPYIIECFTFADKPFSASNSSIARDLSDHELRDFLDYHLKEAIRLNHY